MFPKFHISPDFRIARAHSSLLFIIRHGPFALINFSDDLNLCRDVLCYPSQITYTSYTSCLYVVLAISNTLFLKSWSKFGLYHTQHFIIPYIPSINSLGSLFCIIVFCIGYEAWRSYSLIKNSSIWSLQGIVLLIASRLEVFAMACTWDIRSITKLWSSALLC